MIVQLICSAGCIVWFRNKLCNRFEQISCAVRSERKRKKFSGKCSQTTQKRQQTPEIPQQMFPKLCIIALQTKILKLCANASAKSGFVALQFCSAEVASVVLHHCFANVDYLLLVNFNSFALRKLSIYCLKNTSVIATAHVTSNTLTTNPSAA